MKITDIQQQQKNQNRYSVFADGEYQFSLLLADVQDQGIRVGLEIDQKQLQQLKQLSDDSKLYESALNKALRRPHSIAEIERHLKSKQASSELTEVIISKLVKFGYLDDTEFAQKWHDLRRKSNKSQRYIRGELMSKGVDEAIVNQLQWDEDNTALRTLLQKKSAQYPDQRKLIAYLQRKGFSYHDIQNELSATED